MKKFFIFLGLMIAVISLSCGIYLNFYSYENIGQGMSPTLNDKDKVVIGLSKNIRRGDIIVFKIDKQLLMRRVISIGGEKVLIKNGQVFVQSFDEENLSPIKDDFLPEDSRGHTCLTESNTCATSLDAAGKIFFVPENNFFVLGDNRNQCADSRHWPNGGLIEKDNIIGIASFVFWPFDRIGFIEKIDLLK